MRGRPLADTVAEVEHLLGSDDPRNIARRLGYANLDNLRRIMYRARRFDLADALGPDNTVAHAIRASLRRQREAA